MLADSLFALLIVSAICGVALAIIAGDYLEDLDAREACYMKYGVILQISGYTALCIVRVLTDGDFVLDFMPIMTLMCAGIFMLGAFSVIKAMQKARAAFALISLGIQACTIAFFSITTALLA